MTRTSTEQQLKDIEQALRLAREAHQHEVDAYRPELYKPECDRRPKDQLDRLGDLICLLQNILYAAQQASRRVQGVPYELRNAAQRAHDWMERQAKAQGKGGHATFDLMMLREERDALAAALAAAPQPPEAACNPSMQPELATEAAAEHKALRSVYEAARGLLRYEGVDDVRAITYRSKLASAIEEVKHIDSGLWEPPEAAPVQLPEPRWYNPSPGDAAHFPYYTPEDVSQLLAAQQFTLDELAMLTRKLVQQLRKASPGNESAEKALDYLKRKGLAGNPLRTTQEPST